MTSALASSWVACAACGDEQDLTRVEQAAARSNVRAFREQSFAVWRCGQCLSIHARDEVDLAHYYRSYPFHALPEDFRLRALYEQQLRRLRHAGIRPQHRILDYGCGGGGFVRYLRQRGYAEAWGYDRYASDFSDISLLEQRYDCLISQDVLEHVLEPSSLLDDFDRLVASSGIVAIGTPNAEALDLRKPEKYVHALHLPYHRHIFSKRALLAAGSARGWRLERYYPTQYGNTAVPFLNSRFYLYYMRLGDDSLDRLLEPPQLASLLARLPVTLFWGFFGQFLAEETDVMAVFRRPAGAPADRDLPAQFATSP
jgi:2-polyprenyl-3-methyl-5-hydroxy-6-metoxy-1,4-benzoquinol methylase